MFDMILAAAIALPMKDCYVENACGGYSVTVCPDDEPGWILNVWVRLQPFPRLIRWNLVVFKKTPMYGGKRTLRTSLHYEKVYEQIFKAYKKPVVK